MENSRISLPKNPTMFHCIQFCPTVHHYVLVNPLVYPHMVGYILIISPLYTSLSPDCWSMVFSLSSGKQRCGKPSICRLLSYGKPVVFHTFWSMFTRGYIPKLWWFKIWVSRVFHGRASHVITVSFVVLHYSISHEIPLKLKWLVKSQINSMMTK